MSKLIAYNARFENQVITGVQRYAHSVVAELKQSTDLVAFRPANHPVWLQHLWEQHTLPSKLRLMGSPLLLNFCNTGPVQYDQQIVCIHDVATFDVPNQHRWWFRQYYQWLIPRLCDRALQVVTVSQFSADRLHALFGIDGHRIAVIPPSDSTYLSICEATPPPTIQPKDSFLLSVGSLHAGKNLVATARMLERWCEKHGVCYYIAGTSGASFKSLRGLKAMPHVRLLQRVDEGSLRWLFENATAVVQPSRYEGFGMVPREAAQFTSRILVSDIPAHRESAGTFANFFELDNEASLLEELDRTIAKPLVPGLEQLRSNAADWLKLIERFQ